jgi:hypothetical protein
VKIGNAACIARILPCAQDKPAVWIGAAPQVCFSVMNVKGLLDKNRVEPVILQQGEDGVFMANMAQIEKIISEINELEETEKIIFFHKMGEVFENFDEHQQEEIPIESVFGLWKDRNITKETLRKKAWMNSIKKEVEPLEAG